MKKIYVSVDLEGIGGIVSPLQVGVEDNAFYQEARMLMAGEVNASIKGINEAGFIAVIGDSHGNELNLPIEILEGDFLLCCGEDKGLSMMGGLDETYSGVIFLGYHARFGTSFAVMDHTYSPTTVYSLKINGKEVGEAEINAEVAGCFGIPVIMATGDDTSMNQLKESFPNIMTVTTKSSLGRFSAICEPPNKVRQKIKEAALVACKNIDKYGFLYTTKPPINIEITWNTTAMAELCTYVPGVKKIGDRITIYECDDYIRAFKLFTVLRVLARSVANRSYL